MNENDDNKSLLESANDVKNKATDTLDGIKQAKEQMSDTFDAKKRLEKAIDKQKKAIKLKIIKWALPFLGPVFLWLFIIIAVIASALVIVSFLSGLIDQIYSGADKVYNFFSYGSFKEGEQVFVDRLKNQYDIYHEFNNREGEFDIPLIISTVNYGRVMNPEGFDSKTEEDMDINEIGSFIPDNKIRSFYTVMNDQVGSVYSLLPQDKKLTGHLIDVKLGAKCLNNDEWMANLGEVKNSAADLMHLFGTAAVTNVFSTDSDLSIPSQVSNLNAFAFAYKILSYDNTGINYFDSVLNNYGTGWKLQNPAATFLRIAENSELNVECGSNQTKLPIVIFYQNEDLYREYLKEYFVPQFYIECKTCEYKDLAKDDPRRDVIINQIVQGIFDKRDAYDEIMSNKFGIHETIYVPGLATFPFANNYGEKALLSYEEGGLVNSFYGGRIHPISKEWHFHTGLDFGVVAGTPLLSIADGVVETAGCAWNNCNDGYGQYVKIRHEINGEVYYSLYAHMSKISVAVGTMVGGGQEIGLSGGAEGAYGSGRSTGAHLHFEIRNSGNDHVDPMPYLKGIFAGDSIFSDKQTYYQIDDYTNPYCGTTGTIASNGTLPTAYAIVASELGQKVTPDLVASYVCENIETNRNYLMTSTDAMDTFNIQGTKIYTTDINSINKELNADKKLIVSIKGGSFNLNSSGTHIVITKLDSTGKYLIMDPSNPAKNKLYSKADVESQVIAYVNEGIWSFEGVE